MADSKQRHEVLGEHKYDGRVFPANFPCEILDKIKYDFKLRDDDVLVITYPKSGTTWIQEIVWLLMNDGDIAKAREVDQRDRAPHLENTASNVDKTPVDRMAEADSPRIIKSHLSYDFFSRELKTKKAKVVLGVRNVKDVLVSYYHFYRMATRLGNFSGTFSEFFELFKVKHLVCGDWFDHVLGYWNNRHDFNFFLLKYEDLHKDFLGTAKSLVGFLGKDISDAKLAAIAEHVSFKQMKDNDKVNKTTYGGLKQEISPFLREGKVGDWRNYLTEEQNQYVDEQYRSKIEGTGLEFDFEL